MQKLKLFFTILLIILIYNNICYSDPQTYNGPSELSLKVTHSTDNVSFYWAYDGRYFRRWKLGTNFSIGALFDLKKQHYILFDSTENTYSYYPFFWSFGKDSKYLQPFALFNPNRIVVYLGEKSINNVSCYKYCVKATPCQTLLIWISVENGDIVKISDEKEQKTISCQTVTFRDKKQIFEIPMRYKYIQNLNYRE